MNSLILDTSNRYLVVAMYKDEKLLEAICEEGSKRQSENAIPYIEKLLNKFQMELFDFEEIVVTCGPGSYTGERVGLTIAKTLKTVHEVDVKMISSLASYAGVTGKKISVIDARSKKVFVGVYHDGELVIPEMMIDIQDFDTFMADYPDYQVVGETNLVNRDAVDVDLAQNMFDLAKKTEPVKNVHELLPRYIKDVEAKQIWHP